MNFRKLMYLYQSNFILVFTFIPFFHIDLYDYNKYQLKDTLDKNHIILIF